MTPETYAKALERIAVDNMALGFIVEILLSQYLKSFPAEIRSNAADLLKKAARKTDGLGTDEDPHMTVLLSDVVVALPKRFDGYVDRALDRVAGQ